MKAVAQVEFFQRLTWDRASVVVGRGLWNPLRTLSSSPGGAQTFTHCWGSLRLGVAAGTGGGRKQKVQGPLQWAVWGVCGCEGEKRLFTGREVFVRV